MMDLKYIFNYYFNSIEIAWTMNNLDTIEYLARAEAKQFAPLRSREDSPEGIPYLVIEKSSTSSKYDVHFEGHIGHDNEGRAPYVSDFLKTMVLNNVCPDIDVSGIYPMELHDSYAYLDRPNEMYRGALTFSKDMGHRHVIAFPDPYQMGNYGGILSTSFADSLPFEKKQDTLLFAGTTTGSRDPAKNQRIQACLWALNRRPRFEFYVTQVAQMSLQDMAACMPRASLEGILHRPISPVDHFKMKYILNIAGNTCCWSRVPMVMASNSLLVNLHHMDGTWYYPLLQDRTHMVTANGLSDLPNTLAFCEGNPAFCKHVIENAKEFVKRYCGRVHAAHYARCLFETMAENKA